MSNTLWTLIQQHLDESGMREAEFARRMDTNRSTLNSWKIRGVRALPDRRLLQAVADITGTPYRTVLEAVLIDIGYQDRPSAAPAPAAALIDAGDLVRLSFQADDTESVARQADGYTPDDDPAEIVAALDGLVDAAFDLAEVAQDVAITGIGGRDALAELKGQRRKATRRRHVARVTTRRASAPEEMPPWNKGQRLAAFAPHDGDIDKGD